MKDIRRCPYCSKEIDCTFNYKRINGHITMCSENPKYKKTIANKLKSFRKSANYRKRRKLKCKKCKTNYVLFLTDRQFKKGKYKTHCSRACANGKQWSAEVNQRRSIKAKERFANKLLTRETKPNNKCLVCDNRVKLNHRLHCSIECAKITRSSVEFKYKLSQIKKKAYALNPDTHPNRRCAGIKESYPERCFREYLELKGLIEGVDFERQKSINKYYVDFYFAKLNLGVEIDGERWHRDVERESKREAIIKQQFDLIRFKARPLIEKQYEKDINKLIKKIRRCG